MVRADNPQPSGNTPISKGFRMELAGLEPATSWVRSKMGGFLARPPFPRKTQFAGLLFSRSGASPRDHHPCASAAGLHMGCKVRCLDKQLDFTTASRQIASG